MPGWPPPPGAAGANPPPPYPQALPPPTYGPPGSSPWQPVTGPGGAPPPPGPKQAVVAVIAVLAIVGLVALLAVTSLGSSDAPKQDRFQTVGRSLQTPVVSVPSGPGGDLAVYFPTDAELADALGATTEGELTMANESGADGGGWICLPGNGPPAVATYERDWEGSIRGTDRTKVRISVSAMGSPAQAAYIVDQHTGAAFERCLPTQVLGAGLGDFPHPAVADRHARTQPTSRSSLLLDEGERARPEDPTLAMTWQQAGEYVISVKVSSEPGETDVTTAEALGALVAERIG